jgi:hypothetical protein
MKRPSTATKVNPAIAALNQALQAFWEKHGQDTERRLGNPAMVEAALVNLPDSRPGYPQMPLDQLLALVENLTVTRNRIAASADRPDDLLTLINDQLDQNPKITFDKLIAYFRSIEGTDGVIDTVTGEVVEYSDRGRAKTVQMVPLRNRFNRARRKHRKRRTSEEASK